MYIHSPALSVELISPDLIEKLCSGKYCAAVFKKKTKHFIFFQGKIHRFFVNCYLMFSRTYVKIVHAVLFSSVILGSSKQCPNSGDQLHHTERLRNIIVCSAVQPHNCIKFTAFCSEHDHRKFAHIRTDTDLFQNGKAVLFWKHDIQKYQRRQFFLQCLPEKGRPLKSLSLKPLTV